MNTRPGKTSPPGHRPLTAGIRARFRAAAANTTGAIDLAAIMVGVVVIGIASSTVSSTTFAVIPWSQDIAAEQTLNAVQVAESVANVKLGSYLDRDGLTAENYLPLSDNIAIGLNTDASCYVAASLSGSGGVFVSTSKGPATEEYEAGVTNTDWCTPVGDVVGSLKPLPLAITTTELPEANVGQAYSATVALAGTSKGVTFTKKAGTLPTGLSLDPNGVISGTPAEYTSNTFTVEAAKGAERSSQEYTLVLGVAPEITTQWLEFEEQPAVGESFSFQLKSVGKPALTWSKGKALMPSSWPSYVNISPDGVISGTFPKAESLLLEFAAENPLGKKSVTLNIRPSIKPYFVSPSSHVMHFIEGRNHGSSGSSPFQQVEFSASTGNKAWLVEEPHPSGLSFSSSNSFPSNSTARFFGVPTKSGIFNTEIFLGASADPSSAFATQKFDVVVWPTLPSTNAFKLSSTVVMGVPFSGHFAAPTLGKYSTQLSCVPVTERGISIHADGTVTGTGTANFSVDTDCTVTYPDGYAVTKQASLVITIP